MPVEPATITAITTLWAGHAVRYEPGIYGLVLCGGETEQDKEFSKFVLRYRLMLDDMAGPYTSLILVLTQPDEEPEHRPAGSDVEYVDLLPPSRLHAPGVYTIANALRVPLEQLPAVLLSADPRLSDSSLVISLRDAGDRPDGYLETMKLLLSAARAAYDVPVDERLRLIEKHMRQPGTGRALAITATIVKTGIIKQVIEGLLKGLGLTG
jgi:hypothetical protein